MGRREIVVERDLLNELGFNENKQNKYEGYRNVIALLKDELNISKNIQEKIIIADTIAFLVKKRCDDLFIGD